MSQRKEEVARPERRPSRRTLRSHESDASLSFKTKTVGSTGRLRCYNASYGLQEKVYIAKLSAQPESRPRVKILLERRTHGTRDVTVPELCLLWLNTFRQPSSSASRPSLFLPINPPFSPRTLHYDADQ